MLQGPRNFVDDRAVDHKIKSIKPAAEIIGEMMRDARDILQGGL
jgi:phosphate uptake regulator